MTAVEWLQDCLNIHFTFEQQMKFEGLFQQAKEIEKKEKDYFAIRFADWIRVCKLKGRPYDFENIQELLVIYKTEINL